MKRKRSRTMKRAALAAASVLLLALLLACSGCQAQKPEDWDDSIDITDAFNDALGEALEDNEDLLKLIEVDDFTIDVTASAQEDGSYQLTVDEKALERTVGDVVQSLLDGMEEYEETMVNPLAGNWKYTLDMTDMLYDQMESFMGDDIAYFDFHDFAMNYNLSFTEDGAYQLSVDKAALQRMFDVYLSDLKSGLTICLENMLEQDGYTMSLDDYLMEEMGCTMDEFYQVIIDESLGDFDIDDIADRANVSGTYEADGSSLHLTTDMGDETLSYTLSGSSLTLYGADSDIFGDTLVFTKQ